MESYPLGKSNFASFTTSASLAARSSFLLARVNTASIALNFTGSIGPSGSGFTNTGSIGPQGPTGPTGPKGLGVYLLSSSRATCCYTWDSYLANWKGTTQTSGFSDCSNAYTVTLQPFIYTTCNSLSNGCTVFASSNCSSPITSVNAIYDGSVYYQLSSGVITGLPNGGCTT